MTEINIALKSSRFLQEVRNRHPCPVWTKNSLALKKYQWDDWPIEINVSYSHCLQTSYLLNYIRCSRCTLWTTQMICKSYLQSSCNRIHNQSFGLPRLKTIIKNLLILVFEVFTYLRQAASLFLELRLSRSITLHISRENKGTAGMNR